MREEFRRENMIAFDRHISKANLQEDHNALASTMIRACRAELEGSDVRGRQ